MDGLDSTLPMVILLLSITAAATRHARALRKQLMEFQKSTMDQSDRTARKLAALTAESNDHQETARQTLAELQEIRRDLAEIKSGLTGRTG